MPTVKGMTTTTPEATAGPGRRGLLAQLGADTVYCLSGLPVAIAGFVVVTVLWAAGVGLAITFAGIPILVLCLFVSRGFAGLERARLRPVIGRPVRSPAYKKARDGASTMRRLVTPLTDGQRWLDFLHAFLALIPAIFTFVVTVTWWALGVGGTLNFAWDWAIPYGPDSQNLNDLMGLHGATDRVAVNTIIGLLCLLSLPFVVRGMALLQASFARVMLTRERVGVLQERIEELTGSRAAAVSAEASALRKLERDIHDGPQQRLVRLALELGRAQHHLDARPEVVREALADAIAQTREALDELRALSRGIAPPILVDRGLREALAALAARSTVPAELDAGPVNRRLDAVVETTAYFVVAEALTNVAKHSHARRCSIGLRRCEGTLRAWVSDDGVGGASLDKGHGLRGLDDRLHAAGGRLLVSSPDGGPTTITAELPC